MIASINRTLEQELAALARGASLECLVCGEFVMHGRTSIFCPECGFLLEEEEAASEATGLRGSAV